MYMWFSSDSLRAHEKSPWSSQGFLANPVVLGNIQIEGFEGSMVVDPPHIPTEGGGGLSPYMYMQSEITPNC